MCNEINVSDQFATLIPINILYFGWVDVVISLFIIHLALFRQSDWLIMY